MNTQTTKNKSGNAQHRTLHRARLRRDHWGVMHIQGQDESELFWGLGWAHGQDRALQLLLMRILGRGQGSKYLAADESMLKLDRFFRRMNWAGGVESELQKLTPAARSICSAYCEGLNARLMRGIPWELKLLGYRPDPWTLADCILISRMTGYISLSQSQAEVESLLLQMVQQGIDRERLEALFGPLPELDLELLQAVCSGDGLVPPEVRWNPMLPKAVASNNWVVSGRKSRSGRAMLANDPHLEGNRLPNVWYEAVLESPGRYAIATTMPGLPGLLLGRTPDLAWGATYTFMDAVDSWVEQVQDGLYRRDVEGQTQWQTFEQRTETIERKGQAPFTETFYENQHGTLTMTPEADGYYLATRWASSNSGGESINAIAEMWSASSVVEGMQRLGRVETSWNWVLADSQGHIGYQMSGLMPRRREGHSGLLPVPGWLPENDWQGFVPSEQLPRAYDPEAGYFVTANHDLNAWGQVSPINMPMGAYRAERIAQLLERSDEHTVASFQQIQTDRYSFQARALMRLIRPLLPQTEPAAILRNWDMCYEPESQGAVLFEQIYRALIEDLFGAGCGSEVCSALLDETGLLADFYARFDQILLAEDSPWFKGESREAIYRRAISQGLAQAGGNWGENNRFVLKHLLFGGKLPLAAGFDRGPIPIPGGRATPQQGQIYHSGGRETSFVPSYRLVTDFAAEGAHTCLLGGPSDRRFSKWYASELANWQAGAYKYLAPDQVD